MTETIYRYTCDECGRFQELGKNSSNFIDVIDNLPDHLSGDATDPSTYIIKGSNGHFCSYSCLLDWANKRMEWERLTEGCK